MNCKNYFYTLLVFVLFMSACTEQIELRKNKELSEQLLGEWSTVALKLTMHSYNNRDTLYVFEVKEEEWEQKMNILPIRTTYKADGTYASEHRSLQDKIIYTPAGTWFVLGDTLVVRDTFPEPGLAYKYKITLKSDSLILTGLEDCDRDGVADDDYYGLQRKLRE